MLDERKRKKIVREIVRICLETIRDKKGVEHDVALRDYEHIMKIENEKKKIFFDFFVELYKPIVVPLMGMLMMLTWRGLLDTDIPDVFAREFLMKFASGLAFKFKT